MYDVRVAVGLGAPKEGRQWQTRANEAAEGRCVGAGTRCAVRRLLPVFSGQCCQLGLLPLVLQRSRGNQLLVSQGKGEITPIAPTEYQHRGLVCNWSWPQSLVVLRLWRRPAFLPWSTRLEREWEKEESTREKKRVADGDMGHWLRRGLALLPCELGLRFSDCRVQVLAHAKRAHLPRLPLNAPIYLSSKKWGSFIVIQPASWVSSRPSLQQKSGDATRRNIVLALCLFAQNYPVWLASLVSYARVMRPSCSPKSQARLSRCHVDPVDAYHHSRLVFRSRAFLAHRTFPACCGRHVVFCAVCPACFRLSAGVPLYCAPIACARQQMRLHLPLRRRDCANNRTMSAGHRRMCATVPKSVCHNVSVKPRHGALGLPLVCPWFLCSTLRLPQRPKAQTTNSTVRSHANQEVRKVGGALSQSSSGCVGISTPDESVAQSHLPHGWSWRPRYVYTANVNDARERSCQKIAPRAFPSCAPAPRVRGF